MEEEKFNSIIYLEDRVKKADREILTLKQELTRRHEEVNSKDELIKELRLINERLLKTIETTLKIKRGL